MRHFPALIILLILLSAVSAAPQRRNTAKPDAAQTAQRLRALADSGSPQAIFNLASLLEQGFLHDDTTDWITLYRRAADLSYPPALSHLGYLMLQGQAMPQNVDSGLKLTEKAALLGDPKAANNLGYFLTQGQYVARDYKKAKYWLTKAADYGLPTAQAQLADLYRLGLGTDPDTAVATDLYIKAAQSGLTDAQRKLLALNARKWTILTPDSAFTLGRDLYRQKIYLPATFLLERAAEADLPAALTLLAEAYSTGRGVPYSHEKSIQLYNRAARLGDTDAQRIIDELLQIFPDALQ